MTNVMLITLVGGVVLLLYGMRLVGEGLQLAAGGRMRHILGSITSNPFKGMLVGAFITAVIQSSSATTVMLVGFASSGLMDLTQTVGVILGADIVTPGMIATATKRSGLVTPTFPPSPNP